MLRRVQRERIMALAGPRALLLMAAHPVAFEGFFAHTTSLREPYERLRRTAEVLELITYGPRDRAEAAAARVRKVHGRVRGQLPEPAGRFPAGTPYAADDPDLLLWILASLADSNLLVHRCYVRELSLPERELYWRDFTVLGNLFGIPDERLPEDIAAFEAYMDSMLSGEDLYVTDRARELAKTIVLHPPIPVALKPLLELANFITVGLLPAKLRRAYGLGWDPVRSLALVSGAQYTRRVLMPLLPERFRYLERTLAA